ncbi:MAG: serine/threonine protein kinase, partial [Chloroflexota bacterium]|nr:serine/threonine protein kinase [Chloroflexota bacterium]
MNPQASRNCDVCGAPLAMADAAPQAVATAVEAISGSLSGPICPVCHKANRSASVFCAFCGYRLKQGNTSQPYALPYAGAPSASVVDFAPPPPQVAANVTGNIPAGTVLKRRYRILRKIAQGGMGAVYESADMASHSNARWAVKEISPAALPPEERRQAISDFRREAQMLATLQHPNLPTVAETFEELGKHFLVMEFIPGRTLLNVIDAAPGFIANEQVMVWARQLFDVLLYLHAQNPPIIYRDLKPANVMVVEGTERIKLIDFGIARFHKAGKTRDTEAFGTAGYAPPEQYGKGQTDQRSDIYALAATLHHVITKHDPSLNPFNWLPARRYNHYVPHHVDGALQRALNLDPVKRFATVREFAEALGITHLPAAEAVYRPASQPQYVAPLPPPVPAPAPAPAPVAPQHKVEKPKESSPAQPKPQAKKKTQPQVEPAPPVPVPLSPAPVAAPVAAPAAALSSTAAVAAANAPTVATDIKTPTHTGAVPPMELAPNIPQPIVRSPQVSMGGVSGLGSLAPTLPQRVVPPTKGREQGEVKQEPASAIVVSEKSLNLGEARWNRRPVQKVSLMGVGGGSIRGTVQTSHPWIAYSPANFQGKAVDLEVKVKRRSLPFGREELQVPNLFAIIWARTRRVLP